MAVKEWPKSTNISLLIDPNGQCVSNCTSLEQVATNFYHIFYPNQIPSFAQEEAINSILWQVPSSFLKPFLLQILDALDQLSSLDEVLAALKAMVYGCHEASTPMASLY